MSSNIPASFSFTCPKSTLTMDFLQTRRVTRTTRTTAPKDNENVNARPSRITSRAKPVSSAAAPAATTSAAGGPTRATAATAASRAKLGVNGDVKADPPAGKRKREALGEVTGLVTNNKVKNTNGVKGKDKEVVKRDKTEGAATKLRTTTTTRQPLRTVAGTRQTNKVVVSKNDGIEEVKEEVAVAQVHDENAMIIDPPAQVPALKRLPVRRSVVSRGSAGATSRLSDAHRRVSRSNTIAQRQADEDAEANRVFKKRRTSSEAPEEDVDPEALEEERLNAESEAAAARVAAELEACAAEPEADPEDSHWDDLDFDDLDDPLMVSEYVVDIFKYLKEVEVSFEVFHSIHNSLVHI